MTLPIGIGGVMAMGDKKDPSVDEAAFAPISSSGSPRKQKRAQPRWERVQRLVGSGSAQRAFAIDDRAIQWRAA